VFATHAAIAPQPRAHEHVAGVAVVAVALQRSACAGSTPCDELLARLAAAPGDDVCLLAVRTPTRAARRPMPSAPAG